MFSIFTVSEAKVIVILLLPFWSKNTSPEVVSSNVLRRKHSERTFNISEKNHPSFWGWICANDSVTKLLDYFSIFGHLYRWKSAEWRTKFVKVGLKVCKISKLTLKIYRKLLIFCLSGEILPNMSDCLRLQV